jgi:hypothetical protein
MRQRGRSDRRAQDGEIILPVDAIRYDNRALCSVDKIGKSRDTDLTARH